MFKIIFKSSYFKVITLYSGNNIILDAFSSKYNLERGLEMKVYSKTSLEIKFYTKLWCVRNKIRCYWKLITQGKGFRNLILCQISSLFHLIFVSAFSLASNLNRSNKSTWNEKLIKFKQIFLYVWMWNRADNTIRFRLNTKFV